MSLIMRTRIEGMYMVRGFEHPIDLYMSKMSKRRLISINMCGEPLNVVIFDGES